MNQYVCAISYLCAGMLFTFTVHAYDTVTLTPGGALPDETPTYYTPDRRQAVYLTKQELSQLDYALRFSLDTEQEYNQRIDTSFIRRTKAACKADDACGLIEKVLGDFKGKMVSTLFFAIGLSISI
jgi:hypothetical protein